MRCTAVAVGTTLLIVLAGCGGGESTQDANPTLAQDVEAKDIGQCLLGLGWSDLASAVSANPGAGRDHISATIASPSDGTEIILTDERLDSDQGSSSTEFHVTGKYGSVQAIIAGLSITDEERAQVYDCAAG